MNSFASPVILVVAHQPISIEAARNSTRKVSEKKSHLNHMWMPLI
jgi:hypothetical protein